MLVIAGLLAALVLFRWARTLAMIALVATALWFAAHRSHGQPAPMVECRIGSFVRVVPDYACAALSSGSQKLRLAADPDIMRASVMACATEMARQLNPTYPNQFLGVCQEMLSDALRSHAVR